MIDWRQWGYEPLFLACLLAAGIGFALRQGPLRPPQARSAGRAWAFWAGLAAAYLAVGPPWERVGRYYLFSVEMAEQLALLYIAAPLLLAGWVGVLAPASDRVGTPGHRPRRGRTHPGRPIFCGAVFVLGTGLFYLPHVHEDMISSEAGMALEHLAFLALGLLFWTPILGRRALGFGPRLIYLLIVEVTLAGIFTYLLMAEHAIYPTYEIAPRIVPQLGSEDDQILAGVLMSGVGSLVLVSTLAHAFFAWARESEKATTGRGRSKPAPR